MRIPPPDEVPEATSEDRELDHEQAHTYALLTNDKSSAAFIRLWTSAMRQLATVRAETIEQCAKEAMTMARNCTRWRDSGVAESVSEEIAAAIRALAAKEDK